tara:strand:- start:92 stop:370 length:279 start_codon:yes stop_codon:yes gene_type:complete
LFSFKITSKDLTKPWGGFLIKDETQSQEFSNKFFKGLDVNSLKVGGKLSPKLLIVKPAARLFCNTTIVVQRSGNCIKVQLEFLEAILMLKTK